MDLGPYSGGLLAGSSLYHRLPLYRASGTNPDPRLADDWREVYEDVVWGLFNHHEFVWMP